MTNDDIQATWDYHDGTKHPNAGLFDWSQPYDNSMRPLQFKVYPGLTPTPLPVPALSITSSSISSAATFRG